MYAWFGRWLRHDAGELSTRLAVISMIMFGQRPFSRPFDSVLKGLIKGWFYTFWLVEITTVFTHSTPILDQHNDMSMKVVMFSTLMHILSFANSYMKYVTHRHHQLLDISSARLVLQPSLDAVPMKVKEAMKHE